MSGVCAVRERAFEENRRVGRTGGAKVFDFEKKVAEKIDEYARRLESKHWFTRLSGVCGLYLTGRDSAFPFLVKTLRDDDARVRTEAFYAVLDFLSKRGPIPLLYSLNDGDWFVRSSAAYLLGKSREKKAVEPLRERLKIEEIVEVRGLMAWALKACLNEGE